MAKELIVVGGGVAGCTAALEASRQGLEVTLIDEHPQSLTMMSLDAPYFYGARLSSVLSDSSAVADRVLGANDLLLECLDAGVDVITNTCVWGNFVPGPNSHSSTECRLGVADADRSWLLPYDHLILAAGARDLVLSFPGWHLPGVLGAAAANALLTRYQSFDGTRTLVLGSGNTGLRLAKQLLAAGSQVVGIVEVAPSVRGDQALKAELESAGLRFFLSHCIESALGDTGVTGVKLRRLDSDLQPRGDDPCTLDCDTICLAIGVVPNVELASQTGCSLTYLASKGGWVPVIDNQYRSTVPSVYVVGDGAGVSEEMMLDFNIAAEQGRCAARAIAARSGTHFTAAAERQSLGEGPAPTAAQEWLSALTAVSGLDVVLCQCEEVTRREFIEVKAPLYVVSPSEFVAGSLSAIDQQNVDFLKRLTRVGMGHCQGRRCREHAALLLSNKCGLAPSAVLPGSYRPPVRPIPLNVIADREESVEARATWPTWFQPLNEGEIG